MVSSNALDEPSENRYISLGVTSSIRCVIQYSIGYEAENNACDEKKLMGWVQLDDVYWGGTKHGGKRGRGSAICRGGLSKSRCSSYLDEYECC